MPVLCNGGAEHSVGQLRTSLSPSFPVLPCFDPYPGRKHGVSPQPFPSNLADFSTFYMPFPGL